MSPSFLKSTFYNFSTITCIQQCNREDIVMARKRYQGDDESNCGVQVKGGDENLYKLKIEEIYYITLKSLFSSNGKQLWDLTLKYFNKIIQWVTGLVRKSVKAFFYTTLEASQAWSFVYISTRSYTFMQVVCKTFPTVVYMRFDVHGGIRYNT